MGTQWALGNQNVQIAHVTDSSIHIIYEGQRRKVPLDPAVVPVRKTVVSPARLIRARSGVVPYAARTGLLAGLEEWAATAEPFAGCVIGGGGGAGKTRLGVELSESARKKGWLSGLLTRSADQAALEELVEVPTPRLVVIDYAETRAEQLEVVLPALAARATPEHPVRVLLLVRAAPRRSGDWTEALRHRGDLLDAVLDDVEVRVLEDEPFEPDERDDLFRAAARAFAARSEPLGVPSPPEELQAAMFASPLLVVVAAYLAVHGQSDDLPASRAELLEGLAHHEDLYWAASAHGLGTDEALRQRVVGLATLAGADTEAEAVGLLRVLPDLAGEGTQLLGRLARWAHALYPGPRWWNPLEPDLLAEHLVAACFTHEPDVLGAVLDRDSGGSVVQPLDSYARAVVDHAELATALEPVLSQALERLCSIAVAEVAKETDLDLLLAGNTVAGALDRAMRVVRVDPSVLRAAMAALPARADLVLSPLALTISEQLVAVYRRLAADSSAAHEPNLAASLNNLSIWLSKAGRGEEGLGASEEAVALFRRLAAADPASYQVALARSLNSLSSDLGKVGRHDEALAANEEAVALYRLLAAANPAAHEPNLAGSLDNLSIPLGKVGRHDEALAANEEAVARYRRLAAAHLNEYQPDLASSLNNLSIPLGKVGRHDEALAANEEALAMYRRLAAAHPASYQPQLAMSLNNLSSDLGKVGRHDEALAANEEAVALYQRLAAAHPTAYEPYLATSLKNLSILLRKARPRKALAVGEEAVGLYRDLAAAHPRAYAPQLADSLNSLANSLSHVGRHDDALAAIEYAVILHRRLAAAQPAAYHPNLAQSLNNLAIGLGEVGRHDDALAVIEEAVALYRRLAAAHPASYQPDLAMSLNNLSKYLADTGRREEALDPIEKTVALYRRLAGVHPATYQPSLAMSLHNLAVRLATVGRHDEALAANENAVALYRRLAAAHPASYQPDLAISLKSLAARLTAVGRRNDSERAWSEAVEIEELG